MKTMIMAFLVIYSMSNSPKEISGKVLDKYTSEELVGVRVVVNDKDTTYTDLNGDFIINDVDTLKRIYVAYPSYDAEELSIVKIDDNVVVK